MHIPTILLSRHMQHCNACKCFWCHFRDAMADDWMSDDVDWDELIIIMMLMTMLGERMSVRMLMRRRRRTMKMMRMSVRMLMMMVR